MRWLWIDRFEEFHAKERAVAVKAISYAEDHIHEQYPECPMMPASLIAEGLAQTGGILVGHAHGFREKVVLAKIPQMTFRDQAYPGDVLYYTAQMSDLRPEGAVVAVTVHKNDRTGSPMVEGEIFYAHVDQARGSELGQKMDNFVFQKGDLMGLLRTAKGYTDPEPAAAAEPTSTKET